MSLLSSIYPLRWFLGLALLVVYLASKVRTYRRLRHFKGPFSTGFSDLWHARLIANHKNHQGYKDVLDKYGPIARVGPNDLVTSSLDLLCHMSAARSPYTRGGWYYNATRTRAGKDSVFSTVDEELHDKRKRQLAAGFSGKENADLEATIDTHVAQLVHLIRSKYLSTAHSARTFDLAQKIQYLTLDVISAVGFGKAFGDLQADADINSFAASSETGLQYMAIIVALGLAPWLVRFPSLARLVGPAETDATGFGRILSEARVIIEKRLERGEMDKRSDMLASFSRHGLSADELLTEAALQIIAGSDTTATSLRSTMLYLISHPPVYARLQAEVDAAAAKMDAAAVVSDSVVRGLPYLQAVIKEGMRVYSPVTDQVPKTVPRGGDTVVVDGKSVFLPGGVNVSYGVWALDRSEAIFGPDAHLFRPERWLVESDPGRLAIMNRVHELVFGYGKYQCLGKFIGLMEIGKTIFELMHNFDWCLAQPDNAWKSKNLMGIFVQKDMWVLASDRAGAKAE
ncbi:pisatin demethylase [Magnaporthiopsis poae ATCC 64411]|uniref:Cytochrome P450 monooxygenase ABA1 n=1 Tax=Magnaporthiopsis poae (strain ATCC 64411 / 73-15) TaxID=644358 RepID=A0A0C4EB64_MAGP6|nr:pisatin demethylase [Magnaporthiopsis poae ATCC 64411]